MASRTGSNVHRRPGKLREDLARSLIVYAEAAALASPGADLVEELPGEVQHLWSWFCELAPARGSNGFGGLNPIGFIDIAAWAALTGREVLPWEVFTLRRMDDATRVVLAGKKGGTQILGSVDDASDAEAVKAMFRAMGARAANAA